MTSTECERRRVCTRFAPSPTGLIHLGNIRSALYPWAFAKKHQGIFILRIEDTDSERSTPEAIQAILDSLAWLGLDFQQGPFYQSHRLARYSEMVTQLLDQGDAYFCYTSSEELDQLREQQRLNGEIPRYDGRWRPEIGKTLPSPPPGGTAPVIRFKNPKDGAVTWHDAVKGTVTIANAQLDDLIIARADGTPTYNFCVVVDDIDMKITHVIRGDDHVNNTPRQINLFNAFGQIAPIYAHLPTILTPEGEKMSKRNQALSVLEYRAQGYLPQAILNYLARLGWSHGNDEIFSPQQFIAWFNLENLGHSSAQHNPEKLLWLNQHYLKTADNADLAQQLIPFLAKIGILIADNAQRPKLEAVIFLYKERVKTLVELAEQIRYFYQEPDLALLDARNETEHLRTAIQYFAQLLQQIPETEWQAAIIATALKTTLAHYQLKMPQLAMPLRVLLLGSTHTPAINEIIAVLGKMCVLRRIGIRD